MLGRENEKKYSISAQAAVFVTGDVEGGQIATPDYTSKIVRLFYLLFQMTWPVKNRSICNASLINDFITMSCLIILPYLLPDPSLRSSL
jgi:hypothetical protein